MTQTHSQLNSQPDSQLDSQLDKQNSASDSVSDSVSSPSSTPIEAAAQSEQLPTASRKAAKRRLGVRIKATMIAITLGVVPVLAVGGIATYLANQIITERVLGQRQRLAVEIGFQLNQFVKGRLQDAEAIASTPFIVSPATRQATDSKTIVNYFDGFIKRDPTYGHIFAATPDGSFAFTQDGVPIKSTKGDVPPESVKPGNRIMAERKVPYFLQARDTLRPAVSPLRRSTVAPKTGFFVSVPAFNADTGQLAYVISSRTDVDQISQNINQFLTALRTQDPSETVLQTKVIDHSSAFYEQQPDGKEKEVTSDRVERSGNIVKIDGKIFKPGGKIVQKQNRVFVSDENQDTAVEMQSLFAKYPQLREGRTVTTTTDISLRDGRSYLLAYAPIEGVDDLAFDWGVLVYEPIDVAFAPQRTLTMTLLLGTAITAIIVGTIAAILANRATRPILAAADALEKVGQGHLGTRLNFQGDDEIAVLGTNINTMTAQLQDFLREQAFESSQERLIALAQGAGVLRPAELLSIFEQVVEKIREQCVLDRVVIYSFADTGMALDTDLDSGLGAGLNTGMSINTGIVAESVAEGWKSAQQQGVNDSCIPIELRQAYQQGRVLIVNNVAEIELHPEHRRLLERLNVKASLVIPIVGAGYLFGLLILHSCLAPYDWETAEINFLKRVATELGLSAYRVTLLETTEKLATEQRLLKEGLQQRALELLMEVDPISQGDLTTKARVTADEIGTIADSYNVTVENLRKIVLQVQQTADQVTATADANQSSIQTLSTEALQQAEAIAQALSLVRKMAIDTQDMAARSQQAEKIMQQTTETVTAGDRVMNQTVDSMAEIRATVAETAEKAKHLGEASQKIAAIVDVINGFTSQTNMLAFNASIEASRAGEAGRGFAVVAEEVRQLAKHSGDATEEIKHLVFNIQSEINEVVSAMVFGNEQVVIGSQLLDETRQSLNRITTASMQVSQLVEAIAQTTVAHAHSSETITETMKQIAMIADRTSTEANQMSDAFAQLRGVTAALQDEVGQFKVK